MHASTIKYQDTRYNFFKLLSLCLLVTMLPADTPSPPVIKHYYLWAYNMPGLIMPQHVSSGCNCCSWFVAGEFTSPRCTWFSLRLYEPFHPNLHGQGPLAVMDVVCNWPCGNKFLSNKRLIVVNTNIPITWDIPDIESWYSSSLIFLHFSLILLL